MSSKTTIFFEPTTVSLRVLCGSSQLRWRCATVAGRELEVAEDDVLDVRPHVALAARLGLDRPLADEVEQHGDVVGAEAPERVLVGAHLAEVHAVAVEVVDLAELVGADQLAHRRERRVEEQQVAHHEPPVGLLGCRHELAGVRRAGRERLLDEHVLARGERPHAERMVRRDARRDHDRVERLGRSADRRCRP